jgi:PleD family two-component response regulator
MVCGGAGLAAVHVALGLEVGVTAVTLAPEVPLFLSASVSVTACPVPAGHPDNLMPTADAALYQAKREGRNRVVASRGKSG